MKDKTEKIRIKAEFEIPRQVWGKLFDYLKSQGMLAQAGVVELTPADLVAMQVLKNATVAE